MAKPYVFHFNYVTDAGIPCLVTCKAVSQDTVSAIKLRPLRKRRSFDVSRLPKHEQDVIYGVALRQLLELGPFFAAYLAAVTAALS